MVIPSPFLTYEFCCSFKHGHDDLPTNVYLFRHRIKSSINYALPNCHKPLNPRFFWLADKRILALLGHGYRNFHNIYSCVTSSFCSCPLVLPCHGISYHNPHKAIYFPVAHICKYPRTSCHQLPQVLPYSHYFLGHHILYVLYQAIQS